MTALFGVLFVVLLFGGIAYAEWTSVLYIEGAVQTGKLHLYPELVKYEYLDDIKKTAWFGPMTGDYYDDNKVIIQMENIYPCITAHFIIDVINDGTIPAGLKSYTGGFEWEPDPMAGDLSQALGLDGYYLVYLDGKDTYPHYKFEVWPIFTDGSYNPDCCAPICTVEVVLTAEVWEYPTAERPNSWMQIDPGKWVSAEIWIHFDELLPQGTIFTFNLELEYWNWNEVFYDTPPV